MKSTGRWYFPFDRYALDYLLSCCTQKYEAGQVASTKLITLREHDKARGTQFYETLKTYFNCGFNAVKAAKAMYIHRSTFLSRMDRIRELTAIDFDSPSELCYLMLSFLILEKGE